MLVVGLTGGIGSGKSSACALFTDLGIPVIDADIIARELASPGANAYQEILTEFGQGVVDHKGALDRKRLRAIVFADDEKRRCLEAILHPKIKTEMQRRVAALAAPYCILAIPLLVEKDWRDLVDRILVIDASPELQRQRSKARDRLDDEEINAIIRSQASRKTRLASADDVIVNDRDIENLHREVEALHRRYLALAGDYPG